MDGICDLCNKNETTDYSYRSVNMCAACRRKKKSKTIQALIRRARKSFDSYNGNIDSGFYIGVITAIQIVYKHEQAETKA